MKQTGILAGACALAIGLSAFADSGAWFNANISTYTDHTWTNRLPSTRLATNGEWADGAGEAATLDTTGGTGNSKLVVDTDDDAPLSFGADVAKAASDLPVVSATVKFNTFDVSAVSSLEVGTAKAGLIAVKDGDTYAFYGIVKDGDNNANKWAALSGTAPTATTLAGSFAVEIKFAADGDTTLVSYKIGNETYEYNDDDEIPVYVASDAGSISVASFSGCGEVSALSAAYEIPTKRLTVDLEDANVVFSVASNMTSETELDMTAGWAAVPVGNDVRVYFTPKAGYVLTGKAYVDAKMNNNVTIDDTNAPAAEEGVIKNGAKLYLTMAAAFDEAVAGDTLELLDDVSEAGFALSKAVGINLNTHTYTVSSGEIAVTANTAITNGTLVGAVFLNGGTVNLADLVKTDATFTYGGAFSDEQVSADFFAARTLDMSATEQMTVKGALYATFADANTAATASDVVVLRKNLDIADTVTFGYGQGLTPKKFKITLTAVAAKFVYDDEGELLDSFETTVADKIVKYDTDEGAYVVGDEEPSTVTFSVAFGEGVASVQIGNGAVQTASPATATVSLGANIALTVVAEDWYTVAFTAESAVDCTPGLGGLSVTIDSDAEEPAIGLTATKKTSSDISSDTRDASVIAAEIGVTNTSFTNNKTALSKVVAWAGGTGSKTIAQVNAMNFSEPAQTEKAYLFNVADDAEAVAAAQADFVFPSITPGEVPSITGKSYNGVINYQGNNSLDPAGWAEATTSHKFYRATLTVQ